MHRRLKTIYDLTRTGRFFIQTKLHQEAYEEIKSRLLKPFVLHLPDYRSTFLLFMDTTRTTAGFVLNQIQNDTLN